MIIGDSIALGVARSMPQCWRDVRIGRRSDQQALVFHSYGLVVISLGANDGRETPTEANLRRLRVEIGSGRVVWLVPASPQAARAAVTRIAQEHGDRVVDTLPVVSSDGVHPTPHGYRLLASRIEQSQGDRMR